MFEHYVQVHSGNPRWRRAMGIATIVSGGVTAALIASMWIADAMQVRRVDPPNVEYILVQWIEEDAATPAAPAPPPAAAAQAEPEAESEPKTEPELIPEEEAPLEQPEETPVLVEPKKHKAVGSTNATASSIPGTTRGVPGGDPLRGVPGGTGIPGMPGMPGGVPIAGVATKRVAAQASEVAMKPIAVVRANTLYDPDCDAKKLAGTKSATMGKRPGTTKVSFCVDESGRVVDVKTAKAFPSDPGVDKICRETVSTWRFRPLMVGGKPQKTCSVVAFDIVFE